jgi:proline iminopeptidase
MTHPRGEPYRTRVVETDDGARLHVEESGTPDGVPALWLHGGPGGDIGSGWHRELFAPDRYRVVALDQRGSGRSTPNVLDDLDRLSEHTTARLIADLERVRTDLGIETWVVGGVSWGSTLALAYALEHPDRVRAIGLIAVTTTSRDEVDWITEGVGRVFPEDHDAFERASGRRPGERVVEAYARRLAGTDPDDRDAAAEAWDRWEGVHVSLDAPEQRHDGHKPPAGRRAFATLVTHYWANDGFLRGDQAIASRVHELSDVPAVLVHGRRDVSGPVVTPWRLHQRWPASRLVVIEDEPHVGPAGIRALSEAFDAFAADLGDRRGQQGEHTAGAR